MKHFVKLSFLCATLVALEFLGSCDETIKEIIVRDTVYVDSIVYIENNNDPEIANPTADALLETAYARWRGAMYNNQGHTHTPQTFVADLTMIPTRGTDWADNGKWVQTNNHEWTPDFKHVEEAWVDFFDGLSKSLAALESYESKQFPVRDKQAQAKAMVAFHAYQLFDLFGKVLYDRENSGSFVVLDGQAAFDEIEDLLREAMQDLNPGNSATCAFFTLPAAQIMLAKLYLNKSVYLDRYGTPSFDGADMDTVYKYTTAVIESGGYALESDYFRMFDYDNGFNSEFILVVEQFNDTEDRSFGRNDLARNQVERNQLIIPSVGGSNGGCISPEFFDTWDQTDPRFFERHIASAAGTMAAADYTDLNRGILVGPQFGPVLNDVGDAFEVDGSGNYVIQQLVHGRDATLEVNFTKEVPDITGGADGLLNQGARISKYQVDPNGGSNVGGFDIPLIRLADVYLLRAEATLRGASSGDALADVNTVRTARVGSTASGTSTLSALGSIDANVLLKERAFELYWEVHRRSDMIRFNKWETTWTGKTSTDVNKRVFPIFATAIADFPLLTQNQGY